MIFWLAGEGLERARSLADEAVPVERNPVAAHQRIMGR
jgi:hypothetical protein